MPIVRYDSLFSNKIFDKAYYEEKNKVNADKELDADIQREIYESIEYKPVYYNGGNNPVALNNFLRSEDFNLLKQDLLKIKLYLENWFKIYPITIDVFVSNEEGARITKVTAEWVISIFFSKLVTDTYSDVRALLYADGKKNLEIIAVLLRKDQIDIDIRKIIIQTLLSDEGLLACATGCYIRLSEAARNLMSNFGMNKFLSRWIYEYLLESANLLTISEVSNKKTYIQLICNHINIRMEDMQIHAANYLLSFLVEKEHLPFNIPEDAFHYLFKNNEIINFISSSYALSFRILITSKKLSEYVALKAHEMIKNEFTRINLEQFVEETDKIALYLDALGLDTNFELGEIVTEEGIILGSMNFQVTMVERLIQQGWYNAKETSYYSNDQSQIIYRIFTHDLDLSWIKKKGNIRIPLKNIQMDDENFEVLSIFWKIFLKVESEAYENNLIKEKNNKNLAGYLALPTKIFNMFLKVNKIKIFKSWDLKKICFINSCFKSKRYDDEILFKKIQPSIFRKIDFSYVNLNGQVLSDLDFSEALLSGATLRRVFLTNIDFRAADLSNVDLSKSVLTKIDFYQANLRGIKLNSIRAKKINFRHADLSSEYIKSDLKYSLIKNSDLSDSDLRNTDFKHSNLLNCDFTRVNVDNADFRHATFKNSFFYDVVLKKTNFLHVVMIKVSLENIDMEGMNLNNINFLESTFVNVNLKNSILRNANFKNTRMIGVDLSGADLSGADLSGADLSGADLSGADLRGANLKDAKFIGTNLESYDNKFKEFNDRFLYFYRDAMLMEAPH